MHQLQQIHDWPSAGAAYGVEAIATVMTIENDIIPPTINYKDKDLDDPEGPLNLDYVPNEARKKVVNVALSDNLGFGGHNASIVFKNTLINKQD